MEDKNVHYSINMLQNITTLTEEEIKMTLQFINNSTFISDSDVDEFCEEHNLSVRKVERLMFAVAYPDTNCVYCENNGCAFGMYPCNNCSENPNLKNHFSSFIRKTREAKNEKKEEKV